MHDIELFHKLFYKNENVDMEIYTRIHIMLMNGIKVGLVFDEYGVSLRHKGQDDNVLLHSGAFELDLGGDNE